MAKKWEIRKVARSVIKIIGISTIALITLLCIGVICLFIAFIADPVPARFPNTLWRCEEKELYFVVNNDGGNRGWRTIDGQARWYSIATVRDPTKMTVWVERRTESGEVRDASPFHMEEVEWKKGELTLTYYADQDKEQIFGPAEGEVTLHFYLAEELPGPVSFTDTGYVLGDGTEIPWVEPAG